MLTFHFSRIDNMNPTDTRPMPNAADKAALKAIVTRVIQTCPSLQDTAREVAGDLLKKHGLTNLCLLYTSPSPRDGLLSRMPSSA